MLKPRLFRRRRPTRTPSGIVDRRTGAPARERRPEPLPRMRWY